MEPIFDRVGRVVGWLETEEEIIYDLSSRPLAFLNGDDVENEGQKNIITYRGKHVGLFDCGYIRDHSGAVLAFLENTENMGGDGPVLPVPQVPPVPPVRAVLPVSPVPPVPPVPGISLLSWSNINWQNFLK